MSSKGTTVGLLEVAAGAFPWPGLIHLRTLSRTVRAWALPTEVAIPDSASIVAENRIKDLGIAERAHRLERELASYAGVAEYPEIAPRTAVATDSTANH